MGRKKSSKTKKIVLSILISLVVIIAAIGAYGVYYVNHLLNKVDKVEITEENLGLDNEIEEKYGEIKNIALFGIDAPDGEVGRSDSIMILTLDTEHNKLKLTSIMRDSYVDIPGRGKDKINHAYAFGGPELAIRTLNENFNLNIKDFISVSFTSLPEIIDKLGGINLDITQEELEYINGYISSIDNVNGTSTSTITVPGNQHVNGTQALAYARIRYTSGGDYKRTERHRNVINGIFNEVKQTPITQYPSLIGEFLPLVSTNMSSSDLISLGTKFSGIIGSGIEQARYPKDEQGQGATIDGVYYLTFDIESVKNDMHQYIFEDK